MGFVRVGSIEEEGLAIEGLPVPAYFIDAHGIIKQYNSKALELWGRTPEKGERWCGSYRLFTTSGQPIALTDCPMAQFIRTGAFPPVETAILERPNGELRRIKPHASAIKDKNGELAGFLNLVVDITRESERSDLGTEREDLLDSMMSAQSIGLVIFDYENERAVRANDYFLNIIGTSREEFEAGITTCHDLTPVEYRALDRSAYAEARKRGFWSAFEKEFERKDGRRVSVRISSGPIANAPGHCLVCVEDLTASKKAEIEVELLRAEVHHLSRLSAMGTMTAVLAHEVAQPFSVIKIALGLAAVARRKADSKAAEEAIQTALDLIEREAERGYRLVERMRSFSKPNRTKTQKIDMEKLIRDIVELALLRAPMVSLTIEMGTATRYAFGDPVQIEQVLLNVITNSLEAMEYRGSLTIKVRNKGANLQIEVMDDGPGFNEEALAKAFTPFVSSKDEGTGLGLSICRSLIEQNEGKIAIAPSDCGAHVYFTLPKFDLNIHDHDKSE